MPRILLFSVAVLLLVNTTTPALAATVQGISFADSILAGTTSLLCSPKLSTAYVAYLLQLFILALGNIAMAGYLLLQVRQLPSGEYLERLFS